MRAAAARAAAVVALALVAGCASSGRLPCATGEKPAVAELLYFGTASPSGPVSAEAWAEFLRETVTPRFAQGLTVWPAAGQWQGADGRIAREASFVLSLVHPGDEASEASVRAIAADYKQRFRQEAVLRAKTAVCTSF